MKPGGAGARLRIVCLGSEEEELCSTRVHQHHHGSSIVIGEKIGRVKGGASSTLKCCNCGACQRRSRARGDDTPAILLVVVNIGRHIEE